MIAKVRRDWYGISLVAGACLGQGVHEAWRLPKKERAASGGPPDFVVSSRSLALKPDRCDDYRGCSIRKRNDPRPIETCDF